MPRHEPVVEAAPRERHLAEGRRFARDETAQYLAGMAIVLYEKADRASLLSIERYRCRIAATALEAAAERIATWYEA